LRRQSRRRWLFGQWWRRWVHDDIVQFDIHLHVNEHVDLDLYD
jgi:hypothetical protein